MDKRQPGTRFCEKTPTPKRPPSRKAQRVVSVSGVLIVTGIIVLLTAGLTAGYGFIDDYLAGQRAQTLLAQMRLEVPASAPPFQQPEETVLASAPPFRHPTASSLNESVEAEPSPALPESTVETALPQYDVIGILSIPKLTLELPVLSECSDSLLKISVCRYEGKALDRPERLVVAGHSYKSHFGHLPKLAVGDEVLFSAINGAVYSYTVSEITDISMNDHEALESAEWDITLFTCDSDRSRRVLVRCRENL